jgi:hypothetical protein
MKPFGSILFLTVLAGAGSVFAQSPAGGGASASSSAVVLPASGRNNQGGSVGAAELPVAGTTTSVNTLNPSVQISGPYSGSTRSTTALPFSGKLSLQEALARGLAYNLGAVGLAQTVRQTSAQAKRSRRDGAAHQRAGARLPLSHHRGSVQLLRPPGHPQPDRGEPDLDR